MQTINYWKSEYADNKLLELRVCSQTTIRYQSMKSSIIGNQSMLIINCWISEYADNQLLEIRVCR